MAYYRLYFFNPVSGHIDRFQEYEAVDDAAAIETAERHRGDVPLELWSGGRKVRHFAAPAGFSAQPSRFALGAEAPVGLRIAD